MLSAKVECEYNKKFADGEQMKELPVRKKQRLAGYDYSKSGYYFVTLCIKDKLELLGKINVGATAPGSC